jgi:hypothetical protein
MIGAIKRDNRSRTEAFLFPHKKDLYRAKLSVSDSSEK